MPSATETRVIFNVAGETSCVSANTAIILSLHCFALEIHVTAFYTSMQINEVNLGVFLK